MILSIIVAASNNGVIGNANALPWKLKADLQHFKKVTTGHPIIMGRKTFESIGRPLPNRTNIVLSRTLRGIDGCIVVSDLDAAIEVAAKTGTDEAFIIGGGQVYAEVGSIIDRIYLTRVDTHIEGDTVFQMPDGFDVVPKHLGRVKRDKGDEYDCVFWMYEREE